MKTTLQSLSLSSLLVALAATVAATAGVPLPTSLSAEALLGAFTAVGTALVMLTDYSRKGRALPVGNALSSGTPTLYPAPEAFAQRLPQSIPCTATHGGQRA